MVYFYHGDNKPKSSNGIRAPVKTHRLAVLPNMRKKKAEN